MRSLEEVLGNLGGLWHYATTEWLRLTVPGDGDKTRSRWPTHALWIALAGVDWQSPETVLLDKCSNASNPTELRMITVVLGALTSYMAKHGIDDRIQAMDELSRRLYEHYSTIADKDGLTFDEYLRRRVDAKVRTFNTGLVAPGLVDNLKQDYRDQEADKYRKASRGE